ncbi:MAG: SCP2 sterol-binding domain-containing protein [Gaiellaceae bacterium]
MRGRTLPGRFGIPTDEGALTMADTVQEFFDTLADRADATKIAGMKNSYLFDIEGAGQWVVAVDDGAVSVTEGGGEADTTITTSEETMMAVVKGEQNPTTAYMTGKLKIKGDMGAAMKLQKLF